MITLIIDHHISDLPKAILVSILEVKAMVKLKAMKKMT